MIGAFSSTASLAGRIKNPFRKQAGYKESLKLVDIQAVGMPEYKTGQSVGWMKVYDNQNAGKILKQIRNPNTEVDENL